VNDLLRDIGVTLRGVSSELQRILAQQEVAQTGSTYVIQVLFAGGRTGFQRLDDLVLALVESRLVGFLLLQRNQDFVLDTRAVELLDLCVG
jgi:uncharacterized protein YehS (DUF1456 family)